jgi:hypothetical protein
MRNQHSNRGRLITSSSACSLRLNQVNMASDLQADKGSQMSISQVQRTALSFDLAGCHLWADPEEAVQPDAQP